MDRWKLYWSQYRNSYFGPKKRDTYRTVENLYCCISPARLARIKVQKKQKYLHDYLSLYLSFLIGFVCVCKSVDTFRYNVFWKCAVSENLFPCKQPLREKLTYCCVATEKMCHNDNLTSHNAHLQAHVYHFWHCTSAPKLLFLHINVNNFLEFLWSNYLIVN